MQGANRSDSKGERFSHVSGCAALTGKVVGAWVDVFRSVPATSLNFRSAVLPPSAQVVQHVSILARMASKESTNLPWSMISGPPNGDQPRQRPVDSTLIVVPVNFLHHEGGVSEHGLIRPDAWRRSSVSPRYLDRVRI